MKTIATQNKLLILPLRDVIKANIRHILFPQSKLAREIELQNEHHVFFEAPSDIMQSPTTRTQLTVASRIGAI